MPGALVQLAAVGVQDQYISDNQCPSFSFFNYDGVIRSHSNFAMESIPQTFQTSATPGKRIVATINRQGDLLAGLNLHLYFKYNGTGSGVSITDLPKHIGLKLIDYVELLIGQTPIDRMYGTWMNVWGQLTQSGPKQTQWRRMISGRILDDDGETVYSSTPEPLSPGGAGTVAIIPIPLWFSRNPGLALPLVALQYHKVEFAVKLNEWNCVTPSPSDLSGMVIDDMKLFADFIFIDAAERRRFAQNTHTYLIEQTQYNQINSLNLDLGAAGVRGIKHNEELRFSHPVKELYWIVKRLSTAPNPREEYDYFSTLQTDMCIEAQLICDGNAREQPRKGHYYRIQQSHKYHSGGQNQDTWDTGETTEEGGFYSYSLCLNPEDVQPSGTLNFSRLTNASLQLTLHPSVNTIEVYARNYNVLRLSQGMGGLVFSN